MELNFSNSWNLILKDEFKETYFKDLQRAVTKAYSERTVFPSQDKLFSAFTHCDFANIKVVVLGQDPYHGAGQANGLAFSVSDEIKIPPSLRNIYKEVESDTGIKSPESGNLEHWAKQGVFLLNSTLTVEEGEAGFHQGWGWEIFTDKVIEKISQEKEHVVFLLWGKFAQDKSRLINKNKHLILKTTHPSPLSAYRGFLGCQHFSKCNQYLKNHSIGEIEW